MPLDWTPLVEMVRQHHRFLLTTHVRPDGDGLGSIGALAEVLRRQGKQVRRAVASTIPTRYAFLDPEGEVRQFEPPGDAYRDVDAIIVMDTGTWNQLGALGDFLKTSSAAKVVIDHHPTQDDLGALRLVDTTAEATGRLAYEAIQALGAELTPNSARSLFVALAMDTGWFRHSNTTPATFRLAADLTAAGARPELLYEVLFEQNSLARLKLVGLVLGRLAVTADGLVAYSELHRGDYERTGSTPHDAEDLINYPRSVAGVEAGLFFMEQPRGGVKVSLRSRDRVNVARIAEGFGGGGHVRAAGAILDLPLPEARAAVLDAVHAALRASEPTRQ